MKDSKGGAWAQEGAEACPRGGAPQAFTAELIRRAQDNDQDAITKLYEQTYSSVYTMVRAMAPDDDTALDILQDSYLKAFRSLDKLEDPAKFGSWVKRIARNQTIDVLRQKQPVVFSSLEAEDSDTPLEFEDTREEHLPEAVIDRRETARLMREILDALPEEQRVAITMFYYEQMSVKEIAETLGVTENTVKSRLNYGRKKVEKEVRALEKKGTKLYGLAPLPFLMLLFHSQEASAAGAAAGTVLESITGSLAAEAAAVSAAGTATAAATGTATSGAAGSAAGTATAAAAGTATTGAAAASAGTAAQAAGTAAKIAVKAAGHALRTKIIAGAAALAIVGGGGAAVYQHLQDRAETTPAVTIEETADAQEEEQILPDDFLREVIEVAWMKLDSAVSDNEYLPMKTEKGTIDIPVQHIMYLERTDIVPQVIYYETGGVAKLFISFICRMNLDMNWVQTLADPIAPDYALTATIVLDSFPLKFRHEDGSIEYKQEDVSFYKFFTSKKLFDEDIEELCRYVDHEIYNIKIPNGTRVK